VIRDHRCGANDLGKHRVGTVKDSTLRISSRTIRLLNRPKDPAGMTNDLFCRAIIFAVSQLKRRLHARLRELSAARDASAPLPMTVGFTVFATHGFSLSGAPQRRSGDQGFSCSNAGRCLVVHDVIWSTAENFFSLNDDAGPISKSQIRAQS
jgi:hypothetical protein